MTDTTNFGKTASGLAQSPLGIIALFIVLVYGLAAMVLTVGSALDASSRSVLVYFLVFFPAFVLAVFTYLVVSHYEKLFGPSNFQNEENFIKMRMNAVAMLTAAASKSVDSPTEIQIHNIVESVNLTRRLSRKDGRGCVLWVDDRPENNIYERRAFEAVGLKFTLALSTDEALQQVEFKSFEVVISDMGRREGPREGYVLLDRLRKDGINIPLFFYASSNAPEHKRETAQHGGQGCTNNGQELFDMVMKTVIEGR